METVLGLLFLVLIIIALSAILALILKWVLKKFNIERLSFLQLSLISFPLIVTILGVAFWFMAGGSNATHHPSMPDSPPVQYHSKPPKTHDIPEFPWPPPSASAYTVLPKTLVLQPWLDRMVSFYPDHDYEYLLMRLWEYKGAHLGHVDYGLRTALNRAGYHDVSYYKVPDGFALVTRLEQINLDGTPKQPEYIRWSMSMRLNRLDDFSLSAYLKALFFANPGYFRVIVFVITSQPFSQSEATVSRDDVINWLRFGGNALPQEIAAIPLAFSYSVTALIYEFEKSEVEAKDAQFTEHGRLTAHEHLTNSGIRGSLE